jgi:hypothetical protein
MSSNTKQAEQKRQAAKQPSSKELFVGFAHDQCMMTIAVFRFFLPRSLMFFQCSLAKFGSPSNTSAR